MKTLLIVLFNWKQLRLQYIDEAMLLLRLKAISARLLASINFRLRVVFVSLLLFSFIGLLINLQTDAIIPYCFTDEFVAINETVREESKVLLAQGVKFIRLEDVLTANVKPVPGHSIFFHETSCKQLSASKLNAQVVETLRRNGVIVNTVQLTAREACAVESAALHNSKSQVFVLFASPDYVQLDLNSDQPTDAIIAAIQSYDNVKLRYLNLWTAAKDTPLYDWLVEGQLFKSKYLLSHISDFLRYLTLWRWGGTYLDMDIINLRSFEEVPHNFAGAESETHLAAGVMNLAADGFGHEIANRCLLDFKQNFDGKNWGNNGPGVITRVMQKVCAAKNIEKMLAQKQCKGFRIFERDAFYAVEWVNWMQFFDEKNAEQTLQRTKNSYVVHIWNKHSKNRLIRKGSGVAYELLAKTHCPKVYAAIDENF